MTLFDLDRTLEKKKGENERAVDGHLTDFLYSRTHISLPQGNERAYIEIILI